MALAATLLAGSHSDTDSSTTYVSSSYTPTSNSGLVIVTFTANGTVIPPYTVPSGGGLTYKPELNFTYSGTTPPVRRVEVFSVQVGTSPGSMQTTFTLTDGGGGSTSSIGFGYAIVEFTDQNTVRLIQEIRWTAVSLNPSSPATGTSTGGITMPSAIDTDNRPFSWNTHRSNQATTFTTNWTELLDATGTTPAAGIQAQWRSDAYDTANGVSWGGSAAAFSHIAMEVNHSATTPVNCARIVNWRDTSSVADSTVSVNMPINISSGDLLIATGSIDTNATCDAGGGGEGWTSITDQASGTQCRLKILAKIAAGSDTLSPTLGAAVDSAWTVMRITDHGVSNVATDIEVGTAATGTNANPNPPSKTPSATKDWLVIAASAADDDDNVGAGGTWAPTGYFEVTQVESATGTSSCFVQVAGLRINTGSAVDPGTFTLAASEEWATQTLLIPPAASNATATPSQASGTGSAQAPSFSSSSTFGAATVTSTGTPGDPNATTFVTFEPTTVEGTGAAQAPTLSISGTEGSATVTGTGTAGSPAFSSSATVTPNTGTATGTVEAPTLSISGNAAVATVTGTGTAGAPTITASGNGVVATVTGSGTAGAPDFSASGTVEPNTITGTGAAGAPTISASGATGAGTVSGTGTAGAPSITASGTTGAGTVTGTGTAGGPDFSASATVQPNTATGTGASDTPTILTEDGGEETATPATIIATGTAFTPSITASGSASGGATGTGVTGAPSLTASGNVAPTHGAGSSTVGGVGVTASGTVVAGATSSGTPGSPGFSASSTITPATFVAFGFPGGPIPDVVLPLRLRTRYRVQANQPVRVDRPRRRVPAECCTKVERRRWRV